MKRFTEAAYRTSANVISRAYSGSGPHKGRLRPEIAVPLVAGVVAVTAGVLAAKSLIDRKNAKNEKAPKPHYISMVFSPLDEVDRVMGGRQDWAVADKPTPGQKRARHQVLVVAAEAQCLGLDRTDPHGTADRSALALRTDKGLWQVGCLPDEVTGLEEYGDSRLVVGVALEREKGLAACLGRLTQRGVFTAAPTIVYEADRIMDARHFAETYDAPIIRS